MNIIDKYAPSIEEGLQKVLLKDYPATLYEPCRYVLGSGGKRFRPVLTLLGAGLCGDDINHALPAALSVELIHNFTLVHDDIMDEADSRRGRPSVHLKWDQSTAILSGDMLYAEAFRQLLAYADDPKVGKSTIIHLYDTLLRAVERVCEGQAMDMEMEQMSSVSTGRYLDMIERKTSALISGSLVLGGAVASGSREKLELLDNLGRTIGLAFQIQDDLLDVIADPDKFGKTRGGDIREGKKTFLLLQTLEQCNEIERRELHRLVSLKNKSEGDVDEVIRRFRETGAIDKAIQKVESYYEVAFELLKEFDDSIYKDDLKKLLQFLKNRDF